MISGMSSFKVEWNTRSDGISHVWIYLADMKCDEIIREFMSRYVNDKDYDLHVLSV